MSVETEKSRAIGIDEIRKDIADTQAEIRYHEGVVRHHEAAVERHRKEISDRQEFVGKLRAILAERGEQG